MVLLVSTVFFLDWRRMYPENYTMQNKLEETLTARCNIVDVSQRTQFFYKNDILSQQALHFSGEFDPGSGRTLAACLTHASRTERMKACFYELSGKRVSNT